MIGAGLNTKMMPVNRDIGLRPRASDPFLESSKAAANSQAALTPKTAPSSKAAPVSNTTAPATARVASAAPAQDSFESNLDSSISSKKLNEPNVAAPMDGAPANEDVKVEPRQAQQSMAHVQNSGRRAAMQVFLERMQNEVGIDPERVLEAFSKLSNADLMAPPEESAGKLIKLLGLTPKDSKKALDLYSEMLAMVAATGMAQTLTNNGQQANIKVTDKQQEEIKVLRSTINDMSDRFFLTGHYGFRQGQSPMNPAMVAQAYGKNPGDLQNPQMQNADVTSALSNVSDEDKKALGQVSVDANGQVVQANPTNTAMSAAQLAALANQTSAQQAALAAQAQAASASAAANGAESETATSESVLKKVIATSAPKAATASAAAQADPTAANVANKAAVPGAATAAMAAGVSATGEKSHGGASGGTDKNDKGADDLNYAQVQQAQDPNAKNHQAGKIFNVQTEKAPSHADMQSNIQELISKAQYLSKKGGGEMKISLNPDGLGEVNLKVKMQNGHVNVEMVASNDDAKKSLEKGLSDLKQSLTAHKLNLDSIRIDSSRDIGNQLSHQRENLERGFQQRFLSDFRDRNGSARREMFEYPGPVVPTSQSRDPASNSYVTKRRDNSRRLDLVA